jgi:two-component system, response regulator YesN
MEGEKIIMLKLLIVDDEDLDREGLLTELDWEQYGISEIKSARTGMEAIRIMKNFEPHILMTDIKMPVMSGLQLAEKAKELFPDIKIVFISGYDKFEYAQEAVKLNAYRYLLKPIDNDELIALVVDLVDHIMQERSLVEKENIKNDFMYESQDFLKSRLFHECSYYSYDDESELINRANYLGLNIIPGKYILLLTEIDNYTEWRNSISVMENEKTCLDICCIACELRKDIYCIDAAAFDLQMCSVLISCNSHVPDELLLDEACIIAEELIETVHTMLNISISIGVSSVFQNLTGIKQGFMECRHALKRKIYAGKGKVHSKLQICSPPDIKLNLENMGIELCKMLTAGDKAGIVNTLDSMFNMLVNNHIENNSYIQSLCISIIYRLNITIMEMGLEPNNIFGDSSKLINKPMELETILDIKQWMKDTFLSVIKYYEELRDNKDFSIRREFETYIEKNYYKDITLKQIAEEWHYSPNYLGNIFKQKFNKGFSEYLVEYRMGKAAILLKNDDAKIYEVAHKVGYNNISSFIKQFKQSHKVTPAEYRVRKETPV